MSHFERFPASITMIIAHVSEKLFFGSVASRHACVTVQSLQTVTAHDITSRLYHRVLSRPRQTFKNRIITAFRVTTSFAIDFHPQKWHITSTTFGIRMILCECNHLGQRRPSPSSGKGGGTRHSVYSFLMRMGLSATRYESHIFLRKSGILH